MRSMSRRWIFLPRKASQTGYRPDEDEYKGTNLLITCNQYFSDLVVTRLGPLEKEYGFSSVRKIPGTKDLFVALKVREVQGKTNVDVCCCAGRLFVLWCA